MTSAKNPNPQQPASTATMTNTNDEPASQNHQQELIRLLAQHFNNQLASRATTISDNQPLPLSLPLLQNGPSINNFQSTLAHYHQQQQYRVGQDAINFSTQNRASNLDQLQQQTSATFLAGQRAIRSQQPPSTLANMSPICLTNPVLTNNRPSSGNISIPQQHPASCNPFMADMNLLNALNCFGLPNDQFVLSLQQQYLIQAASAARQLESRLDRGETTGQMNLMMDQSSHETAINKQNQQHTSKSSTKSNLAEMSSEMASNHHSNHQNNHQSGRELLKFSINTILGRGSPLPPAGSTMDDARSRTSPPINPFFYDQGGFLLGKKFADGHQHESQANNEQPISPECDPDVTTDIDSEPSSTPNPAINISGLATNSSRLSNHPEHHHNHQSASSSTTTNHQGLATSNATASNNDPQLSSHQHQSLSFLAGPTAFPWTVASRGKPRRGMMRRAVFSDSQRVGLEKRFQLQKYISKPDRKKLAEKLGLRDSQVKIWFQNRRMKWRNSKERELLSAGGSREQTLPTRNNPNPDLSDVGETFKRLVSGPNNVGTT